MPPLASDQTGLWQTSWQPAAARYPSQGTHQQGNQVFGTEHLSPYHPTAIYHSYTPPSYTYRWLSMIVSYMFLLILFHHFPMGFPMVFLHENLGISTRGAGAHLFLQLSVGGGLSCWGLWPVEDAVVLVAWRGLVDLFADKHIQN